GAGVGGAGGSRADRVLPPVEPDGLAITLTSEAVVPGPGDDDAAGEAVVALVDGRNELCVEIAVRGLDQPTSAHLHEADAGEAGDVVLALPAPRDGDATVDACVSAEPAVLERLRAAAQRFYVIVHSTWFPDGALRGQLR
nr:CHRD domain-containing protein [Actinomycetota bacterium]